MSYKILPIRLMKTRKSTLAILIIFLLFPYQSQTKTMWECILNKIISDTILVTLPIDTTEPLENLTISLLDERGLAPKLLCIHEATKFMLPIDLYVILDKPLQNYMKKYATTTGLKMKGSLSIKKLDIWHDPSPAFSNRYILNAYTLLKDESGKIISDWTWEITAKTPKKKHREQIYSELIDKFLTNQCQAIKNQDYNSNIYPYSYKRNLTLWIEFITFPNGYIIIPRIMLYYPEGQSKKFIRATKYIYYKNTKNFKSIAINGMNQLWYYRLNQKFLMRWSFSVNIGINSVNPDRIKQTIYYNLFTVNALAGLSFEFNRRHQKGTFAGIGTFIQVNALPTFANKLEPGAGIYIGYMLP